MFVSKSKECFEGGLKRMVKRGTYAYYELLCVDELVGEDCGKDSAAELTGCACECDCHVEVCLGCFWQASVFVVRFVSVLAGDGVVSSKC
jgi:hypothetical protein